SNTLLLTFFFPLTLPSFCVASVLGFFIFNLQLTDCIYSNIVLFQCFVYIFCKGQCMCTVTMNTNGICSQRNFCFLLRNYDPFCHHFYNLRNRLFLICNHRVLLRSRSQRPVCLIRAICKYLMCCS